MTNRLDTATAVLTNFQKELERNRSIWLDPTSSTDHANNSMLWAQVEAEYWINLDTSIQSDSCHPAPIPDVAEDPARDWYENFMHPDNYLQEVFDYVMRPPRPEESLKEYIRNLEREIYEKKGCKSISLRSLRGFLAYLRAKLPKEDLRFIDVIFPPEMRIWEGRILKKVPQTAYPIDVITIARILQILAKATTTGRNDARLTAAETLALAFMCLAAARTLQQTEVQLIHASSTESLKISQDGRAYYLVPTKYEPTEVVVSPFLGSYLQATCGMPPKTCGRLLERHLTCLESCLRRAIQEIPEIKSLGKITFLTFLSRPHYAFGHRHQDIRPID